MKTFSKHYEDWKRGAGAKFDGMDERATLDIFAAGFWIGFESARQTVIAGIAQALAPSQYENTNAEWKEAGPKFNS